MPFVAPWTLPPDFLGYTRAGAEAGLAASRTRQAADEAAQRTALGYAQLASQQNEAMARIAAAREAQAINAAESLRSHRALEAYRGTEEQNRLFGQQAEQAAQALRERHQGFLEQQANRPEAAAADILPKTLTLTDETGNAANLIYNPKSGHFILNKPEKEPTPKELNVSGEIAGDTTSSLPTKYSGPLSIVQKQFGTNLPSAFRAPTPIGNIGDLSIMGIPTGPPPLQAGGVSLQPPSDALTSPPLALPSPVTNGLQIGEIRKGYRYKGGDPADRNSWEKVQ